jgi:hypothetical protein
MSNSAESAIVAPSSGDAGGASVHDDAAHAPVSLGTAIREALRGTHRDFTEGTVSHAILTSPFPWCWR